MRILTTAAFVIPAAGPGCATVGSTNDDALDVMVAAARGASAVDTVWPGYRPFDHGFIIFEPGSGAWLTTDEPPPAPWTAVHSAEPGLRDRLYHRSTDLPGLTGGIDTEYPIGEEGYPAVEIDPGTAGTLATLYHEAFHTWQHSNFSDAPSGEFVPASGTTPAAVAAIELERRILAAALGAGAGARADSLTAAFLAVRMQRLAEASDTVRTVDRMLERLEGTANLVGYQAAATALGRDPERVRTTIIAMLEADLADHAVDLANRYYRWRAYGTGAAIGLLLDRLGSDWRAQTAAGTPLDSLLLRAARIAPSPSLMAFAQDRFGYDDLLLDARRDAPAVSADPLAEFLARAPHRLVIEIVADSGFSPSMSFDPGSEGWTTPEPSLTLLTAPSRASMTGAGFDLSVTNRPLIIDGRAAPLLRLVVLLPEAARVNGTAPTAITGPIDGTLRFTGKGTELLLRGANLLSIRLDPGVLTLRVRPPGET
ncbi:MAG TPA: hypothetical protein VHG09_15160 [Longimicrobiales bacterium]|nr:hypothetical protein [Longimicrobiales bacterium]